MATRYDGLTQDEAKLLPDMFFQLLFADPGDAPKLTAAERKQRRLYRELGIEAEGADEPAGGNGEPEAHTTRIGLDITQVTSYHTEQFAGVENGEAIRVYLRSGGSHLLYCTVRKFVAKRTAALKFLGRRSPFMVSLN